jgi:hypothetical protein
VQSFLIFFIWYFTIIIMNKFTYIRTQNGHILIRYDMINTIRDLVHMKMDVSGFCIIYARFVWKCHNKWLPQHVVVILDIYIYWDEPYQVYHNKSLKIPKGQSLTNCITYYCIEYTSSLLTYELRMVTFLFDMIW